jgi:small subunit ribosomal protein S16
VAVKIKLKRIGKKKSPHYRIVVVDSRKSSTSGDYLDNIGSYNPLQEKAIIDIDSAKAKKWLGNGAQPTEKVAKLLKSANITK